MSVIENNVNDKSEEVTSQFNFDGWVPGCNQPPPRQEVITSMCHAAASIVKGEVDNIDKFLAIAKIAYDHRLYEYMEGYEIAIVQYAYTNYISQLDILQIYKDIVTAIIIQNIHSIAYDVFGPKVENSNIDGSESDTQMEFTV